MREGKETRRKDECNSVASRCGLAGCGSIAMGGRLWYNELVYRNRTSSCQELVESNCRPFGCRQGGAFII